MRILVVSDLHYTLKQLDWVAAVAPDYDLVVVAGDLLDIASIVEPDAQIAVVLEYLARIASRRRRSSCAPGNHDLNARNELDERAARWLERRRGAGVFVDGARLETDDVLVTVCPWWDGPRTSRRSSTRQLAEDAALVGDRTWIWVYHAPPDESPTSWTGKRHYGDEELVGVDRPAPSRRRPVRARPPVAVRRRTAAGSTASAPRWSSTPAGRSGPVPTHIEIDTDRGAARWSSLEAVDERALAGSLVLGVGIALRPSSLRGPGPCIRLPSTTSIMPSPPSWSAYWCLRSAR